MKSLANVVGGNTARACDSCVKKRARWYCAADDAFLCHSCDGSVHSANPLARRHERVRLKYASERKHRHLATWHQGFTRKARTPRGGKKSHLMVFHDLVPEMSMEDRMESYEVEEELIFQVPVLNPMVDEKCLKESLETKIEWPLLSVSKVYGPGQPISIKSTGEEEDNTESCLNGLFPTDMELAQFTADVETLLGGGIDQDFQTMEDVGLSETLKVEKEDEVETRQVCELDDVDETSPFEIRFDYEYTHKTTSEEEDDEKVDVVKEEKKEKGLKLRLDYESVISTWKGLRTPWTIGEPPQIDLNMLSSPTNSMGNTGGEAHHLSHFRSRGLYTREAVDGEREARVSRYREKRRTRLFSKKIRYEVRKLNAEKRPRMKGRFVKRSSISAAY